MAITITRTNWIDDDGSGTYGTVLNNAAKTSLYDQIDAALALLLPLAGGTISGNLSVGGTLGVTGAATFGSSGQFGGRIKLSNATAADVYLQDSGAGANLKNFYIRNNDGTTFLAALNDAENAFPFTFLTFDHATGASAFGTTLITGDYVTAAKDQDASTVFRVRNNTNGASAYAALRLNGYGNSWDVRVGSATASSNALEMVVNPTGTPSVKFAVSTSGAVSIPGTLGVTGATTLAGLTLAGGLVSYGANDSGGTGKRQLLVPNA